MTADAGPPRSSGDLEVASPEDWARFEQWKRERAASEEEAFAADEPARPKEEKTRPPFTGVKEVVLDGQGRPKEIEKRPPPPPRRRAGVESVRGLPENPVFLIGCFLGLGVLALILAIASADQAASS